MDIELLQLSLQILRGRIPFHAGIGGEDNFLHSPTRNTGHQLLDLQVIGANAFDGRQDSLQDMILTVKASRAFKRKNIQGFFDDTNE